MFKSAVSGALCIAWISMSGAYAADLGTSAATEDALEAPLGSSSASSSGWSFTFTPYGWAPWLSGDMTVAGRNIEVDIGPITVLENLDFSQIPAWMSYMEARNGRLSLFNDIVYSKFAGAGDFAKARQVGILGATLAGSIEADYEQTTIEVGAAYQVWSDRDRHAANVTAFDVLGGARYWRQDASLSAFAALNISAGGLIISGDRVIAQSRSIDWIDPFIGARLRHSPAPGQELMLRSDIGGFGIGSELSWQLIGTYGWQMCNVGGLELDGYVGYRALSVDYEQGTGFREYNYDVLQHGPVFGVTTRF
jgi:hypothetical protein